MKTFEFTWTENYFIIISDPAGVSFTDFDFMYIQVKTHIDARKSCSPSLTQLRKCRTICDLNKVKQKIKLPVDNIFLSIFHWSDLPKRPTLGSSSGHSLAPKSLQARNCMAKLHTPVS